MPWNASSGFLITTEMEMGKVDEEMHRYARAQDADWALRDNDYDGRFEKKILWGVGIFESTVDLPVPTGVHIDPKP